MSPRATALPPNERRTALVRSALEIIRERGTMPTTREIAEAAGVAEGTIFRAFDTKERLIEAIVGETFCPAPIAAHLQDIDMKLPLRERLVQLVTILQGRFTEIFGVMSALGLTAPPADFEVHRGCRIETGHVLVEEQDPSAQDWGHREERLLAFIEPDAHRLRCTAGELLKYIRLLTFSGSHPEISQGETLSPTTIVDVVLSGVLQPKASRRRT